MIMTQGNVLVMEGADVQNFYELVAFFRTQLLSNTDKT